jgi:hypothetical protein
MAVDLREKLFSLIRMQLDRKLRYRCLVIQVADIAVLDRVCQDAREGECFLGENPHVMEYLDLMDDVGALSCSKVIERIDALCASSPLVLAGPLHYLTYWSGQMQGAFWKHLAGFTHGPGILVVDTPREEVTEGPFRVLGKIPGTEVRFLKSRLASTQDGLV